MVRIPDRDKGLSNIGSDIPEWERSEALLRDLGADEGVIIRVNECIDDRDVASRIAKLRNFAQDHPLVVLGTLSALLAGGAVAARQTTKKGKRKTQARQTTRKKTAAKRGSTSKRTLIEPHPGDKRYVRRDAKGRIKESVDVGRSLAADRRRQSKTRAKPGAGDKGDR